MDFLKTVAGSLLGGALASIVFLGLVKGWFAIQLERFKSDQASRLEPVKAQLSLLVRLQAGVHEKRADVAAQVLIACLRYLDMLAYICSPAHFGNVEGLSGPEAFAKVVDERWKEAQEFQVEFSKARALTDTYLPLEIADLMKRIWSLRAEIWANQSTHFGMAGQGPGMGTEYWRQGFGSIPEGKASALKEEAKTILRPIVQQEEKLTDASASRGAA